MGRRGHTVPLPSGAAAVSTLFTETCAIERRGEQTGVDRYNQPVYGPPVGKAAPCWWEPLTTSEDILAAEQYTLMITIYLPLEYEAAVAGCDAIRVRGRTYEVQGRPQVQPSGFVVDGYVKALLKDVTG